MLIIVCEGEGSRRTLSRRWWGCHLAAKAGSPSAAKAKELIAGDSEEGAGGGDDIDEQKATTTQTQTNKTVREEGDPQLTQKSDHPDL